MINSKLVAYRYFNGKWDKINRWKLKKMSEVERKKFKHDYFPLYLTRSKESSELTYNVYQNTFRFKSGQKDTINSKGGGLTIAHQLAQEVLSDMRYLKLRLKDKRTKPYLNVNYDIEVDNVILEKKIDIGDNTYFADLLVVFSKPAELALQWRKVFALEVFVTSDTKAAKIIDFEKRGIPLIEVSIGPKLRLNKSATSVTEEEEEELRSIMERAFRKQIFGDILVSPSCEKYLDNEVILDLKNQLISKNNEIALLFEFQNLIKKKLKNAVEDYNDLVKKANKKHNLTLALKKELDTKKSEIKELQQAIQALENKSGWSRITDVFKHFFSKENPL